MLSGLGNNVSVVFLTCAILFRNKWA